MLRREFCILTTIAFGQPFCPYRTGGLSSYQSEFILARFHAIGIIRRLNYFFALLEFMARSPIKAASENDVAHSGKETLDFDDVNLRGESRHLESDSGF